jgi:hypothetical protein
MPNDQMPTTENVSRGALGGAIALSLAIVLLWVIALAALSHQSGSDAAGNGLAQAFAAIELFVLWTLLAILTIVAAVGGAMPPVGKLAALILVPATGVAAFVAQKLLAEPRITPYLWPLLVPAVTPPLVIAFSLWTLIPDLRRTLPAGIAVGVFIAGLAAVCVALGPMMQARNVEAARLDAEREKIEAAYASLPADAALADLLPFLETRNAQREDEVLERIRARPQRQSEAEAMLARGDFPLKFLGRIDLLPSPAICENARAELRQRVAPLVIDKQDSRPYADVADEVEGALAAMDWLVGYGCPCDDESLAWEQMANKYRDTNFDVVELKELRDPKALGQTLREDPENFLMLNEQSSLKAWLKFADKSELRAQAIAGARKLDHRNADAIAMLNADEYTAWAALEYLPQLDLEPTPELCTAALAQVHRELEPIYRATADDPRSYQELEERMGTGEPLAAVIWLARHGCPASKELDEAEELVRTYQDSPDRAAMLATLGELRHKQ